METGTKSNCSMLNQKTNEDFNREKPMHLNPKNGNQNSLLLDSENNQSFKKNVTIISDDSNSFCLDDSFHNMGKTDNEIRGLRKF